MWSAYLIVGIIVAVFSLVCYIGYHRANEYGEDPDRKR